MSSFTINDDVTLTSSASIDNVRISGNTVSSTDTDGHIVLAPNGNGNVGIGTSNPNAKVDIGGNTDGNIQAILTRGNDVDFQLQAINSSSSNASDAIVSKFGVRHGTHETALLNFIRGNLGNDGSLAIVTNNAEQMRVDSAGNVGIGTTSPTSRLTINSGSTNNQEGELAYHGLAITTGTNDQTMWLGYDGSADVGYINCAKSGTSRHLCLQTRGYGVGIGTSSPAQTLDVNGTIAHKGLVLSEGTTPNVDEIKTFALHLEPNTSTWINTGIQSTSLATGTYIVEVFSYSTASANTGYLEFYDMRFSGIMTWISDTSGVSVDYNEILLHSTGRANGGNVIYLRTASSGGILVLQMKTSTRNTSFNPANPSYNNFTFKFRRMI